MVINKKLLTDVLDCVRAELIEKNIIVEKSNAPCSGLQ